MQKSWAYRRMRDTRATSHPRATAFVHLVEVPVLFRIRY